MNRFKDGGRLMLWAFLCLFFVTGVDAQQITPLLKHKTLRDVELQFNESSANGINMVRPAANGSVSYALVQSNQYRFTYVPDAGFTGQDTFQYEYWRLVGQAIVAPYYRTVVVDVTALDLVDDYFVVDLDGGETELDVLSNDRSAGGNVALSQLPYTQNIGAVVSDDGNLVVHPQRAGTAFVRYVACDEDGNCASATATILVKSANQSAVADTTRRILLKNQAVSFFTGSDEFSVLLGAEHGTVSLAGTQAVYEPARGYTGPDAFTLVREVDGTEWQQHYMLQVIDFDKPNDMLVDDQVYTVVNEAVSFNVRDNDLIRRYGIHSFSQPVHGVLTNLGSGDFVYTPNAGYAGVDAFTYKVCALTANCETAVVHIEIDNKEPEGTSYTFTTPVDVPYVIEYLVPVSSYGFEILEAPVHGLLELHPGQTEIEIDGQPVKGYNLMVYHPVTGYTGTDEMRIRYCAGGDCKIVKIYMEVIDYYPDLRCYTDCVWPGDINDDGRVDMGDLLPLAYYLGEVGTSRPGDPGMWVANAADDWGRRQVHAGADLKHTDADGNGIVSVSDTAAIHDNYGRYHRLAAPAPNPLVEIPFILEPLNPEVEVGDTAYFNIHIGTPDYPAYDFTGLSFRLDFEGADFLDTSSIHLSFEEDSWLAGSGPALQMQVKPYGSRVDAGFAKADGRYSSGYGIVGQLDFIIVKNLDGFHISNDRIDIPINLHGGQAMLADGRVVSLPPTRASVRLRTGATERPAIPSLLAYPNPAGEFIHLQMDRPETIHTVELISVTGQRIREQRPRALQRYTLQTGQVAAGIYMVRVTTDSGVYSSKVQISH